MSEETLHESTTTQSRAAIASYLRQLADGFDSGAPVQVDGSVTVDPPAESEVRVEVEREDDELSLELEVSWPEAEIGGEADAAAVDDKADEIDDGGEGDTSEEADSGAAIGQIQMGRMKRR